MYAWQDKMTTNNDGIILLSQYFYFNYNFTSYKYWLSKKKLYFVSLSYFTYKIYF